MKFFHMKSRPRPRGCDDESRSWLGAGHLVSALCGALVVAVFTYRPNDQGDVAAPAPRFEQDAGIAAVADLNRALTSNQNNARGVETVQPTVAAGSLFTEEMVSNCLEVAELIQPDAADQLQRLHKHNTGLFMEILQTKGRNILAMAELKERQPKVYMFKVLELKYDSDVKQAAASLRAAVANGDMDKIKRTESELTTRVDMLLAMTIAVRTAYLEEMNEAAANMSAAIDALARDNAMLVAQHVESLKCADGHVLPPWHSSRESYLYAATFGLHELDETRSRRFRNANSVADTDTAPE